VVREPDVRSTYTNLHPAADRVEIGDKEYPVKGSVLVGVPHQPVHMYGHELEVEGKLETPPVFEDFSYRDYLARRGMHGVVGWPKIRPLSRGGGGPLYRALLVAKAQIQATVAHILPEPAAAPASAASLHTGILLGVEAGIPEPVKDAFSTGGTIHAVAVSGFN
jgi:competence protein ComEC